MIETITLCSATLGEDGKTEPPLGPLYIASALESQGVVVDFRDYQLEQTAGPFDPDRLARFLDGHAEVVAISCFVDMLPVVVAATRLLHEKRPDVRIVLGGPGPTAKARRIIEAYPWIEAVVRGEGEETIIDWVRVSQLRRAGGIPGAVLRDGATPLEAGERPRILDLESLPAPAYHLLDWRDYTHARVITTRGCSYQCSFCDVTALWGNRSVFRNLDFVVDEMEHLRDAHGKSSIAIVDDTFVLNRRRVHEFCDLLIERRAGIEWGCFGRINLMNPELIAHMRRAGCRAVFYGIDSGAQSILNATVKRMKATDVMPVLEWSADAFDKVEASFIWGYPFERLADFKETLALAAEAAWLAPTVNVQLHMLSPLPLSPIYTGFNGRLQKPEPEDRDWLLLPALLLDSEADAIREVVESAPDIYPGFFTFPTPAKKRKRAALRRSMRALDRTIGRTLVESEVGTLLEQDDRELELQLLSEPEDATERIGVGLALGLFRRSRRRAAADARGASMVRERAGVAPRKSRRPVVFLGPSLPHDEAREILEFDCAPPVKRGDLPRLPIDVPMVVIVDGEFGQNLSVSPKEILGLLDRGIPVLGASSMGALRAVELEAFGMEGCGWVFAAYRDGRVEADDEVAMMFSPDDLRAQTVPLVNVRYWTHELEEKGLIDTRTAGRILDCSQAIFFGDRTDHNLSEALGRELGRRDHERLLEATGGQITDIKAIDARAVLRRAATLRS